ncbi:MAG: nucleotidyltransferase family protein [Verrucomicrobia bacterium]|nr:nucleotidyltransferase family protein [Verrucomicrobiota bacterium]
MPPPFPINRAFILGAGLGVRLRPLTQNFPKPLLPVRGRPLVAHGIRHLAAAGVREAIINTHHAAERWPEAFPRNECAGVRITLRHEPVLLDTGGGLKNVEDFLADHGTFFIYNGDILTTIPLEQALAHHRQQGNLVTMILRSGGGPRHVALDARGCVADIRGLLGSGKPGSFLFTGIHVVEPDIFRHIPAVKVESIIAIYLNLIRQGLHVGGVVLDEGEWSDIGTPSEYERVNRSFQHCRQPGVA